MAKLISQHNVSVVPAGELLPSARLHDLRHLHATTLLLAGVPVHVVAARLGHADPAVILRVYARVLREQAAKVGDIFPQAVMPPVSKRQRRGLLRERFSLVKMEPVSGFEPLTVRLQGAI